MVRTIGVWILLAVVGATVIAAQDAKPKFEVTSVKPDRQGGTITLQEVGAGATLLGVQAGGRFIGNRVTVAQLLAFAYGLKGEYQVAGLPEWVRTDRFVIEARAKLDATADEIKMMVRSLLEDRFKLVAHMEPREMRYQTLVLAKANKGLGPGLFPMDVVCTPAMVNELRRKLPEKYVSPLGNGMMSSCSTAGVGRLADLLTSRLGTPVIDGTGLEGPFYFALRAQLPRPVSSNLGAPKVDPSDLPALSTALEEQLGLKMESRKGPIDVLVIDSVSRPTEN
jgi:uncharacterized protein (TIGR03435 family)